MATLRPFMPGTSHPAAVLVVVGLDRDGWRSITHDAAGVMHDLAELRPDLLHRVLLIAYKGSMGQRGHCQLVGLGL